MLEQVPGAIEDQEEAKERAEFEAAMVPNVEHLSPEMYNLRFALFSAAKDEAAARRKEVAGTVKEEKAE